MSTSLECASNLRKNRFATMQRPWYTATWRPSCASNARSCSLLIKAKIAEKDDARHVTREGS